MNLSQQLVSLSMLFVQGAQFTALEWNSKEDELGLCSINVRKEFSLYGKDIHLPKVLTCPNRQIRHLPFMLGCVKQAELLCGSVNLPESS